MCKSKKIQMPEYRVQSMIFLFYNLGHYFYMTSFTPKNETGKNALNSWGIRECPKMKEKNKKLARRCNGKQKLVFLISWTCPNTLFLPEVKRYKDLGQYRSLAKLSQYFVLCWSFTLSKVKKIPFDEKLHNSLLVFFSCISFGFSLCTIEKSQVPTAFHSNTFAQ